MTECTAIACGVLATALLANGPNPALSESSNLYGWLAGDWTMTATLQPEPGKFVEAKGDIHFGWILDGRAMQDVWNLPGWFYGTTLRIYDPEIDAWHILWNEPVRQYYTHLIGRRDGDELVQTGKDKQGRDIRWRFTEITPVSFRWIGEYKTPDGAWFRQCDIQAKRAGR